MKTNKGISLVALIITIIVMLILAGIIIVSAVADGGIIDRAQTAMKENERAQVEELVIASYVYKTTASMNIVRRLDLEATAKAIYENLTINGYEISDEDVVEFEENGELVKALRIEPNNTIDISVEGKHGEYTGTVASSGLQGNIEIVEEKSEIPPKEDVESDVEDENEIPPKEDDGTDVEDENEIPPKGDVEVDLDLLKDYFITGEDISKRIETPTTLTEILNAAPSNVKFKDDDSTTVDESETIILTGKIEFGDYYVASIEYNSNKYSLIMDSKFECIYVSVIGEMVYGKIYTSTITAEGISLQFNIGFSKKYNRIFVDNIVENFTYDKEYGIITSNSCSLIILDNGNTMMGSKEGISAILEYKLTDENLISNYGHKEIYDSDVYTGCYYNENIDKFIIIRFDEDISYAEVYWEGEEHDFIGYIVEAENSKERMEWLLEGTTSRTDTTVVDETRLSKDGNIYTLLTEALLTDN